MTVDDARLAEIRARLNAATPGPWYSESPYIYPDGSGGGPDRNDQPIRSENRASEWDTVIDACWYNNSTAGLSILDADRDLIAHAPQDLADLLAEVQHLRDQLAAAEPQVRYAEALQRTYEQIRGVKP